MNDERAIIQKHSKSFSLAARLLSPQARRHAELLYAWCRYADDLIDHAPDSHQAQLSLHHLRADLDRLEQASAPQSVPAQWLAIVVQECDMPLQYPRALLEGLEMDLRQSRYPDWAALQSYAHRVAGVVGLMMCHALGVSDEAALPHAGALGLAMQLTNISRDVAEDWERGRLYLPLAWLPREPKAGEPLRDDEIAPAVLRLLGEADQLYAQAENGLAYLDPRSRLAIRLASRLYQAIGVHVRQVQGRPSAGRAIVPNWQKGTILARTLWETTRETLGWFAKPATPRILRRPTTVWDYHPVTGYHPVERVDGWVRPVSWQPN